MTSSKKLRLSQFAKLIALLVCLLSVKLVSSQERLPELIAFENDTLVTITEHQFDVVLFAFSYVKSLENTSKLTSKQLSTLDSINTLLEKELRLERLKMAEMDSISRNLESIVKKHKKALRKQKTRETLTYIFGGAIIAAETGLLLYIISK